MNQEASIEYMPTSVQRRNLIYVVIDGAAIGLMSAAASFVSVFVIRLGASPLWVSLLSSIPSTIALVMTLPWSHFAERQTRPQRVFAFARLAVHIVYPLVAVILVFLQGELAARVIILVWSLSALPSSLSNVMFTLVMGNAMSSEKRSLMMSRRWMVLGAANLIALPLISQLIDRLAFPLGYQVAFGLNALIAVVAFVLANRIEIPERKTSYPRNTLPLWSRVQGQVQEVLSEKPFLVFVGGRTALNLGLAMVSAIVPIFWVNGLGATDTWVGYINAASSGSTLVAYAPWTFVKRKYGTRWTLIPSVLGVALYPALLALARAPAAVLPIVAFNGLVGSGLNLAFFDALLDTCPRNKQALYVAINMTAVHLMGVIGPPLGAALLDTVGIRWVLVIATCVAMVGVGVFTFVSTSTPTGRRAQGGIRRRLRTWIRRIRQIRYR
ncbi:MAG: MFS transporter [Anaerolineae bacterium]|nr:MAG: MFS transporter [Anaerolineae bacterium]